MTLLQGPKDPVLPTLLYIAPDWIDNSGNYSQPQFTYPNGWIAIWIPNTAFTLWLNKIAYILLKKGVSHASLVSDNTSAIYYKHKVVDPKYSIVMRWTNAVKWQTIVRVVLYWYFLIGLYSNHKKTPLRIRNENSPIIGVQAHTFKQSTRQVWFLVRTISFRSTWFMNARKPSPPDGLADKEFLICWVVPFQ